MGLDSFSEKQKSLAEVMTTRSLPRITFKYYAGNGKEHLLLPVTFELNK